MPPVGPSPTFPGTARAVALCRHSSVLADAGVRKPRSPSLKEAPFDAVLAEDNVLVHNPAKPTSASLIGSMSVWLLAWELCAAQVSRPAGFLGSGLRLSSDPAAFRAVILALHRLKDIDPGPLLEQLKLLQEQMHQWSEAASCETWYPKAVERLEGIRYGPSVYSDASRSKRYAGQLGDASPPPHASHPHAMHDPAHAMHDAAQPPPQVCTQA